jgi:hypothetical protein
MPAAAICRWIGSRYGQCVPHSSASASKPARASMRATTAVCSGSPLCEAQATASSSSLRPSWSAAAARHQRQGLQHLDCRARKHRPLDVAERSHQAAVGIDHGDRAAMRRFADAAAHRFDQDRVHAAIVVLRDTGDAPATAAPRPLATIGRMSATALGLVLFAALLHALWNVVAKRTGGDARFALISALFLVVVWAPLGIWAASDALPRWGRTEWAVLLASAIVTSSTSPPCCAATGSRPHRRLPGGARHRAAAGLARRAALARRGDEHRGRLRRRRRRHRRLLHRRGPGLWAKAHDPLQRARVRAGIGWGAATGALIAGYT